MAQKHWRFDAGTGHDRRCGRGGSRWWRLLVGARLRDVWSGEFESREQPKRASFGSEVWFVSCGTVTGWLVHWSTVDVRENSRYRAR